MKVCRTGALTALSADDTATSAYSSHTERSPAKACAASPADTAALPELATSTSLRRSIASASEPPSRPIETVGTICASPRAPTANGDRVMSYTCSGTAKWSAPRPPRTASSRPTAAGRPATPAAG